MSNNSNHESKFKIFALLVVIAGAGLTAFSVRNYHFNGSGDTGVGVMAFMMTATLALAAIKEPVIAPLLLLTAPFGVFFAVFALHDRELAQTCCLGFAFMALGPIVVPSLGRSRALAPRRDERIPFALARERA